MIRLAAASLLVIALAACTEPSSQGDTDGTVGGTDPTSQATWQDDGCYDGAYTTGFPSPGDAWIFNADDLATPLWTAPRETCEYPRIVDLDFTPDGALYVIGTGYFNEEACNYECPWHHWLRRVGAGGQGGEEWTQAFDAFAPIAVRALPDGGAVVGGAAIAGQDLAPWLARFNAAGTLVWETIFAERGQINALALGRDDVLVAVGSVEAGATTDLWAVQVTADGTLAWTTTLGDDRHESAAAVAVDAAGRAWIVGGRHATLQTDEGPPFGSNSTLKSPYMHWYDLSLVALIDPQGGLLWLDEPAPMDASESDGARGIGLLPDGDAVVGASWDSGTHWIARYTADGSRVWETVVDSEMDEDNWGWSPLDDLVCDDLGRTHILARGVLVQLDDTGNVLETVNLRVVGTQLALAPGGALLVTDFDD